MKKDNPIPGQLAIFADRLRQVCRGHRTACACDGPPGLGKTHTLKAVTAEENKLLRLVSTTAGGLVQMLYRYKDIPVVAFDDFDKALRNEATANIVKQATAPEPVRRITHQTVTAINNAARNNPKDHIAPPVFSVRCGLVMLTNVDMTDPKTIDKAMREHVRALADRGLEFIHISRDPRHVIDYVADLAPTIFPDVDPAIRSEVAEFFVENGLKFETVSVRRIQSIMKDRLTMPVRWKQLQASTFVRDAPRVREPGAPNHSENTEVGKSAIVPFRGMRREYSRRNESKARARIAEMEAGLQARASVESLRPEPNPDPIKDEEDRLRRKLKKHDLVLRKSRLDGTYTIAQVLTGEPACHCMTLDEVITRLESENFENEPLERYSAGPAVQNRKSASKEHLLSKLRQKMKEVPG